MIIKTQCPHCSADHIVAAREIGGEVVCPKCSKEHPVFPRAETVTDGLLAGILAEQRSLLAEQRIQLAELQRVRSSVFWIEVVGILLFLMILVFGFLGRH